MGAVAIGMGAALANGVGVAYADDTDASSSAVSNSTATRSPDSNAATGNAVSSEPTDSDPDEGVASGVSASVGNAEPPSNAGSGDDDDIGGQADLADIDELADDELAPGSTDEAETEATDEYEAPPASVVVGTDIQTNESTPTALQDHSGGHTQSTRTDAVTEQTSTLLTDTAPETSVPAEITAAATTPGPPPALGASKEVGTPTSLARTMSTTTANILEIDAAAVSTPAKITVGSILTDVLTWIGLGPLAANLPVPALPVPGFVEAMWLAVRQNMYTWNNQRPVATATISGQDPLTGIITGHINTVDYEGDPITYIVSTDAAHGDVVVDADGTFTYTPDPGFALTGGGDRFVITVDDRIGNPPHTYGLLGALGLLGPTTTALRLTVAPVLPLNRSPIAGTPPFRFTVDAISGVVTGSVTATDPDGDELTFLLDTTIDPAQGSLVVDRETGEWAYTPTQAAREAAYGTAGEDAVSFSVTVSDGAAQISVDVGAPILELSPPNHAPEAGTPAFTVDSVDSGTGLVTGTVNVTDPDGNNLSFAPADEIDVAVGTVVVDPATGQFTFTPTEQARLDAWATPEADEVGFSILVTDGHDVVTVDVAAPISPYQPPNHAPEAGSPAFGYTADPDTGVLTGTVNVTDPDGDILSYTVATTPNSALGGLAVDPTTGAWVFTPSTTSLAAAYRDASPLVAEFTITVNDGQTSTPVTVSAPISASTDVLVSLLERAGSQPSGVAVSADGTVYVINSGANTLSVLGSDGTSITSTVHVGDSPSAVDVGPDGRVWVTNGGDGTVTVLDQTGTSIVATIDVGSSPIRLAFGTEGLVYVADAGDGTVSVIDAATNLLDRTIAVGGTPTGIATGPDGRIYVADFTGAVVTVIDTAHSDALTTIDILGANPFDIAVSDAGTVYVTAPVDGTLRVLTPTADGYTSRIVPVGVTPTAITLGDDGSVYVTDTGANTVTIIDPDTFSTTAIATATSPNSVTIGTGGNLYITSSGSDYLDIIDAQNGSASSIPVGVDTSTVTADTQGNLTVTNNFDTSVSVINHPATGTVSTGTVSTGTVTTGTTMTGTPTDTGFGIPNSNGGKVVVSPDSRYAYVADYINGTVTVINPTAGTATTFQTGFGSYVIVASPDSRYAYVADYTSGTVTVINPTAGTATTFDIGPADGHNTFGLVVSPDSRYAYATNYRPGGAVSVINPTAGTATTFDMGSFNIPMGAVVSPDSRYAYATIVTPFTGTRVALIDPTASTATDFGVGRSQAPVVVSPDSRYAYSPNYGSVSVIDPATGTAITIPTGDGDVYGYDQSAVVVSPDSRYAYALNEGSVTVIDPATGTSTVIATDNSGKFVVSPDSRYGYVPTRDGVMVINPATGTTTTIATGYDTRDVVVSPDGRYAYVTTSDGVVVGINPVTGTITSIAPGGNMVFSPDSRYAYVTTSGGVMVINPATGTTTTIATGYDTRNVVVSSDSRYAYVLHRNGVTVINPATGTSTVIATRSYPWVEVGPDSRYAYVTSYDDDTVTIVNPATGTATTTAAENPSQLVVSPDGRYAYVTTNDAVMVIDSEMIAYPGGVAPNYWISTDADEAVTFDPRPNTAVTITGISQPTNGTAVVNGSRITYTPNAGYTGTETFTYTATNGVSTGTGTIEVLVKTVDESVRYESGPTGTEELYTILREAMDGEKGRSLQHGIYTQHVLVNGRQSLIVYIAGTKDGLIGGDQSKIRNLASAAGIVDQNQINVIKAAMTDSSEPILLAGFSQGGMDAQNIAAYAWMFGLNDQIKAVVTYGSPIVQIDRYPTVHLQDPADAVPKINLPAPANLLAGIVNTVFNKNVYLASSRNTFDTAVWNDFSTWGVHGVRETYEDIGRRFDGDTSSHWHSLHGALAAFLHGQVVPDGYTVIDGIIIPEF